MNAMTDLREQLIDEMKAVFGADQRRIDHALRVLAFAEQILTVGRACLPAEKEQEPRPDEDVVIAAAILHDVGIAAAEAKKGASTHRDQEIEGPPVARAILEKLALDAAKTDHVCEIIAHHHNGRMDTPEFNIIWDADWLVNFPCHYGDAGTAKRAAAIAKIFRTPTGRAIAERLFMTP